MSVVTFWVLDQGVGPGFSSAVSTEQLRLAVAGLAGIIGFLGLPILGAWLRLMLEALEWNRPGLGRGRQTLGAHGLKAFALSSLVAFFLLAWFRAASELRSIHAEEPVVLPSLRGLAVGAILWSLYGLGLSMLRAELERRRARRRVTGLVP